MKNDTARIEENKQKFLQLMRERCAGRDPEELLGWLECTDFFTAPASTRFHGAYPGGLCEHSLLVHEVLEKDIAARKVQGIGEDSVAVCALLHDVCKANFYEPVTKRQRTASGQWEDVQTWTVNDAWPMGHGEKSVILIDSMLPLGLDEALAIRWHMGAYDDAVRGGSRGFDEASKLTPLVLLLHQADAWATAVEKARERIENDETDLVWKDWRYSGVV